MVAGGAGGAAVGRAGDDSAGADRRRTFFGGMGLRRVSAIARQVLLGRETCAFKRERRVLSGLVQSRSLVVAGNQFTPYTRLLQGEKATRLEVRIGIQPTPGSGDPIEFNIKVDENDRPATAKWRAWCPPRPGMRHMWHSRGPPTRPGACKFARSSKTIRLRVEGRAWAARVPRGLEAHESLVCRPERR